MRVGCGATSEENKSRWRNVYFLLLFGHSCIDQIE